LNVTGELMSHERTVDTHVSVCLYNTLSVWTKMSLHSKLDQYQNSNCLRV